MKKKVFILSFIGALSVFLLSGCVFGADYIGPAPYGRYVYIGNDNSDGVTYNAVYYFNRDGIFQADIPYPKTMCRYRLKPDGKLLIINSGDTEGDHGKWEWKNKEGCLIFNDVMKFKKK